MINHDTSWYIMIYQEISRHIMIYHDKSPGARQGTGIVNSWEICHRVNRLPFCLSMPGSCRVLNYVMQCPFKSICSEFKLKIFCELPTPLPLVHDHWLLHCWTGDDPTINFSAWKSSTLSACYHWESPTTPILTCGRKHFFIGSVFADKTELWP